MRFPGMLTAVSLGLLALLAACKTSTAEGNAGAGAADGGMGSAVEGARSGVESAAQGVADAGAAAYGAARESASSAATTAADAAKGAASAAADAGSQAASSAVQTARSATSAGEDGGTAEAGGTQAPANDAQIAAIVHAANQGDILKSQLAKKRTKNARVKAFATMMIKDHTAMDAKAKKLGVEPEENETSRALTQGAQDALGKLEPLKGKEFDTAYAENEVSSHEKVIKTVDEELIPNARDAKLKSLLESASKKLKMHLDRAQKLQSALSK